jgi:hypothetical protein
MSHLPSTCNISACGLHHGLPAAAADLLVTRSATTRSDLLRDRNSGLGAYAAGTAATATTQQQQQQRRQRGSGDGNGNGNGNGS